MIVQTRSTRLHSFARLLCALALLAGAMLLASPPTAIAATFTVTKTTDSKDGACNSDCSLREAVIAAHQQSGVDTITLAAGLYRVTLSDIDITSSLTIVGAGAATTIIESNGQDRVFEVRPGATVTIDKVTIRNGKLMQDSGGGILNDGSLTISNSVVSNNVSQFSIGGGIFNRGMLTLTNSVVSGNSAVTGAGISNFGTTTISDSAINNNGATDGDDDGYGGGIHNNEGGTLVIAASSVRNNTALSGGGGIYNQGTLSIGNSTISGNVGNNFAGGIFTTSDVSATIGNSTISGNSTAGEGGGILYGARTMTPGGNLFLRNVTIANNIANSDHLGDQTGGGIHNSDVSRYGGPIFMSNTIIAGNSAAGAPDCAGAVTSQGYNLIGDTSGCTISGTTTGNKLGVNAQLGPLQNNGGPMLTHLPASGSPAIDAGSPDTVGSDSTACPALDQRGVTRPRDGNGDGAARCDIGAVER